MLGNCSIVEVSDDVGYSQSQATSQMFMAALMCVYVRVKREDACKVPC